jgi:phage-related protein
MSKRRDPRERGYSSSGQRFFHLHKSTFLAVYRYLYIYTSTCILLNVEVTRKPLLFVGSSHDDLKAFPDEARRDAGFNLDFVQRGLEPENWKPMRIVGPGVKEIRVRDATGAFRVIYLATRPEAVYVLHCFQKKSRKTRKADVELAARRFAQIGG